MLHTLLHSGLSVDATHLPHAHSADASHWQEFWRDGGSGGEYDTPFASLTRAISEAHEINIQTFLVDLSRVFAETHTNIDTGKSWNLRASNDSHLSL